MGRGTMGQAGRVMLIAGMALLFPGWLDAQPADTPETRRSAALKYLAAVPVESVVDDMVEALARQIPAERREEFVRLMKKITRLETLKVLTVDGIAKHFTVAEIDAMTKFYGSAEGQAIVKKLGLYMGDVLPAIQAEVFRALQEVRAEMRI